MSTGNSNPRKGRSIEQSEVFERLWDGLEVIDAVHEIRVAVLPEDVDGAIKTDPKNCVLAKACQRSFGVQHVAFFRRTAYVQIPDERGNQRVERFKLSQAAFELLEEYDQTGSVSSGAAFILRPPKPSETLEGMRDYAKERRHAVVQGERKVNAEKSAIYSSTVQKRKSLKASLQLRDGMGMVQFQSRGATTVRGTE